MRYHAYASTRGTSMLQPTTVSTRPSGLRLVEPHPLGRAQLGEHAQRAGVAVVGGGEQLHRPVVRRDDDVAQEHPQQAGAEPAVDVGRLADHVVEPDRVGAPAQQRVLGVVGDPVVLAEPDRATVDLPDPVADRRPRRGCPGRSSPRSARPTGSRPTTSRRAAALTHRARSPKSPSVIGRSAKRVLVVDLEPQRVRRTGPPPAPVRVRRRAGRPPAPRTPPRAPARAGTRSARAQSDRTGSACEPGEPARPPRSRATERRRRRARWRSRSR